MDPFESKLRALPLRQPSDQLDERVLSAKPTRKVSGVNLRRPVPLWIAIAATLLMSAAGFSAGHALRTETAKIMPTTAEERRGDLPDATAFGRTLLPASVQVIYHSPSGRNAFDFTRASDAFLPVGVPPVIKTSPGDET